VVSTASPTEVPELVDWDLAARVGRRVAGGEALEARPAWSRQFTELSTIADQAVAEFTGLGGNLGPPVAEPLDRGQWVENNLATLRRVLRPLAERLGSRKSWQAQGAVPNALRASTRTLTGAEAGTLLGYVAQRVLGQYDLPVPSPEDPLRRAWGEGHEEPHSGAPQGQAQPGAAWVPGPSPGSPEGRVWYVVPNVVSTERRHGFRPRDFRLWIALHETAHRRQFRGVPWLPGHVQGLLDEYLGSVQVDEEALHRVVERLQGLLRRALAGERIDLFDLVFTAEQRQTLNKVQATMTVLEGHGEFVMHQLGARMVPGHEEMRRVMHERRNAGGLNRVIQELLGLRQKLDQYARGERFIAYLYERGGMELVNRVFAAPSALPTLDEVSDPGRYLARSGG
jgi:coenzyme F420 biosynthesis associated uncharacterized protein